MRIPSQIQILISLRFVGRQGLILYCWGLKTYESYPCVACTPAKVVCSIENSLLCWLFQTGRQPGDLWMSAADPFSGSSSSNFSFARCRGQDSFALSWSITVLSSSHAWVISCYCKNSSCELAFHDQCGPRPHPAASQHLNYCSRTLTSSFIMIMYTAQNYKLLIIECIFLLFTMIIFVIK